MKSFSKTLLATSIAAASMISFNAEANLPTQVQYSTDGSGVYDITGIDSIDYQNDSTLIIVDAGATTSTGETTVSSFFNLGDGTAAAVGDTISFDIHYQSRVNTMTGGTPVINLDLDGAGADDGVEITVVISGRETAEILAIGPFGVVVNFTAITGTYQMFHDTTADSDLVAGTGFDDGVQILEGSLGIAGGSTFTGEFTGGGAGSTFLSNTITSYNTDYIQADPAANAPLIGTSLDTTINFDFNTTTPIDTGATIGVDGATVAGADLKLAADAGIDFQRLPEPSSLVMLGGGLLLMSRIRRKA